MNVLWGHHVTTGLHAITSQVPLNACVLAIMSEQPVTLVCICPDKEILFA